MEFAVLGDLRARDGGGDRTPRGQRSRDLLAVLLTRRGQTVDASVLLDLVWGEAAPGLAISVVHTQVARLRRDLGPGCVETCETGYRLVAGSTDADRFAELVARAQPRSHAATRIENLREALRLWRSDQAFAGVTPELVAPEVTRLHEARMAAMEQLAEALLDAGDPASWAAAAELSRELMARDPLRERGYELGMLAAERAERFADALALYERLGATLRAELGIGPGPAAQRLHAQLLQRDRPEPRPPREASRERPPEASRRSALGLRPTTTPAGTGPPAPLTRMVGRDAEIDAITAALRDRRAVTLTGAGGVGKSRLLAELHARLAPDWCGYLELGDSSACDARELAESVGQALGLVVGEGDPVGTLVAAIGTRPVLLMADEVEHHVDGFGPLASRLLHGCRALKLVCSSRRPLGLVGEAVVVLAPLPCPPPDADAASVQASAAVQLLRERIADHAPDLFIGATQWPLLGDLARRVDGLPLALELLAAQTRTNSLEQLSAEFDDPLRLTAAERDRPARHRSLREAIDWSVRRLTDRQRTTLARLSVFAGAFTPAAGQAVTGATDDFDADVRSLVRDALVHVQRDAAGVCLRILTPTRAYARAELQASGHSADTLARYRRWHAERWRGALRSDAMLGDVRAHYQDYVQALRGSLEASDRDTVADLTLTLGKLWVFHDMLGPGLRWSEHVLASGLLGPLDTARVRTMRSTLQTHHDPAAVRRDLTAAIPVLAAAGDAVWLTTAELTASLERYASGDAQRAMEHALAAVAASRATTPERQADALGVLACTAATLDHEVSDAAAAQAWHLVSDSGSAAATASIAANLAWTWFARGRHEQAREVLDAAIVQLAPGPIPLFLQLNRAWAALLCGQDREAIRGFADVVSANPTGFSDRKSAEAYLGAAIALARVADPTAAELLAGAVRLQERTALHLMSWQEDLLTQARDRIDRLGGLPWPTGQTGTTGQTVSGRRLATLLQHAAGHPEPSVRPPAQPFGGTLDR